MKGYYIFKKSRAHSEKPRARRCGRAHQFGNPCSRAQPPYLSHVSIRLVSGFQKQTLRDDFMHNKFVDIIIACL